VDSAAFDSTCADDPRNANPLPIDPSISRSTLASGMRCWIKPHPNPPRRISLWLRVGCGSLGEDEHQLGYAHFVEHLAFRGSANFAPGGAEQAFEAMGMRLGRDQNAFTTLHHTTYTLALPDTDASTLDTALTCLADFAFRLRFPAAEVERERAVILEEMRSYRGFSSRIQDQVLELLLPGSRVARRTPLGIEDTVASATSSSLERFYRRWYRPERSVLLIAGEVDPAPLARAVAHHFGDWRGNGSPPTDPAPYDDLATGRRAAVITDPEVTEAQVRVFSLWPLAPSLTVGDMRQRLTEEVGLRALNRRLGARVVAETAPYRAARAIVGPLLDACTHAKAVASGPASEAPALLASLLAELHRYADHGVLEQELEEGVESMLRAAGHAVKTAAGRETADVLRQLHQAVSWGRTPMSVEQRRDLMEELLPEIDAAEVHARLCARFDPSSRVLLAVLPSAVESVPDEQELLGVATEVESTEVSPPVPPPRRGKLLERTPIPGTVAEGHHDGELGVLSATLSNGVRLHVREMHETPHRVFVNLTLGGGRIGEDLGTLGLTTAAALVFSQPATPSWSSVDIRDRLSAYSFSLGGWVDEDAVSLAMTSVREELEHALALLHIVLAGPRLEGSALSQWQQRIERYDSNREGSVESRLAERSLELLTGGDPRFAVVTPDRARAITREHAQAWLEQLVHGAPLEIAIIGDMDRERLLELGCTYLGSLPARPAVDPDLAPLRRLDPAPGPLSTEEQVPTVNPRAAVLNGWRAAPWGELRTRRVLRLAERILVQRLHREVRDRQGLTYSAECSYSPSKAYPAASILATAFYTAPDRVEEAARTSRQLVERFAAIGPTSDELESTRRFITNRFTELQGKPQYWSRILCDLGYRGLTLGDLRQSLPDYLSFTRSDVRDALHRYVTESGRLQVVCRPA
jgi:zinc protease